MDALDYEVAQKAAAWLEPIFANRRAIDLGALPYPLEIEGPDPEDRPDEVFARAVIVPPGAQFLNDPGEGDYLDQIIERGEPEWWLDGEVIVPHRGSFLRFWAELFFDFRLDLYVPRRLRIVSVLPRRNDEDGPGDPTLRYDDLFPA